MNIVVHVYELTALLPKDETLWLEDSNSTLAGSFYPIKH